MHKIEQRVTEVSRFLDKNLATYFEYSGNPKVTPRFIKNVISPFETWGQPAQCPINDKLYSFHSPIGRVSASTTFGGPGSKYKNINEDSFFFGTSAHDSLIAGVIDGSGGSRFGYLGGRIANETLASELYSGTKIPQAFALADNQVTQLANGGYATGVVVEISQKGTVALAVKGDSRALTMRRGQKLVEGTTKMQSQVALMIENGELPAHAIHTAKNKNIVYSVIGNRDMPLYQTRFAGEQGDLIILASDGLWDLVSDHEVQVIANSVHGSELQALLYQLAYSRNNSANGFTIQFSPTEAFAMPALYQGSHHTKGDNITVSVVEIVC